MKTNSKRVLMIAVLALLLASFAGCTAVVPTATEVPVPTATEITTATETALKVFTAEELAKFDGQHGNPAYVAVDGMVYDVSSIPQWNGGSHAGGTLKAGEEQTEAISRSPHGKRVLEQLPVVGTFK